MTDNRDLQTSVLCEWRAAQPRSPQDQEQIIGD